MSAFARSPPALGLWFLTKSAEDRRTFRKAYLESLGFEIGDRVCGVYKVTLSTPHLVILSFDVPKSYTGSVMEGLIAVQIMQDKTSTVFANHTIMWRKKGQGQPGVLEGRLGRWIHGIMVRGLVEGGVNAVYPRDKKQN
jgi:hypothetical protein